MGFRRGTFENKFAFFDALKLLYLRGEICLPNALFYMDRVSFCEFWDFLCPGFAPNPFLCSSGFGVSLLGLFWSGRSSPSRRSLGFLLCCSTLHAFNACITSERGGGQDSHPPLGSYHYCHFRSPRNFWVRDGNKRQRPSKCCLEPSSLPDIPPQIHKAWTGKGCREATVLSRKCD